MEEEVRNGIGKVARVTRALKEPDWKQREYKRRARTRARGSAGESAACEGLNEIERSHGRDGTREASDGVLEAVMEVPPYEEEDRDTKEKMKDGNISNNQVVSDEVPL